MAYKNLIASPFLKKRCFLLEDNCFITLCWFCRTSTWVSHRYMYVPSLLNVPPISVTIHPSRLSQSTGLSSLCHTANSHWLSVLHMAVYMFPCYSLYPSYPLLPYFLFPYCLCVENIHVDFNFIFVSQFDFNFFEIRVDLLPLGNWPELCTQ